MCTHLYFMPVCFPVDSLSEMCRGVKEPKLRAMMATVRNLALAWFTTLGLVVLCLLWSPLPLFRLWSVQAIDTCMLADLQLRGQSPRCKGEAQTGQGSCREAWSGERVFDQSAFFCSNFFLRGKKRTQKPVLCFHAHIESSALSLTLYKRGSGSVVTSLKRTKAPQFVEGSLIYSLIGPSCLWWQTRKCFSCRMTSRGLGESAEEWNRERRRCNPGAALCLVWLWEERANGSMCRRRERRVKEEETGSGNKWGRGAERMEETRDKSLSRPGNVQHHTFCHQHFSHLVTSSPVSSRVMSPISLSSGFCLSSSCLPHFLIFVSLWCLELVLSFPSSFCLYFSEQSSSFANSSPSGNSEACATTHGFISLAPFYHLSAITEGSFLSYFTKNVYYIGRQCNVVSLYSIYRRTKKQHKLWNQKSMR